MGQIRSTYEESKQWIDVQNIGELKIFAFSPCMLIASEGEPDLLTVCAVNDRSLDQSFVGQGHVLVMNGIADIIPGGYGRVSMDWPLMARVNAFDSPDPEAIDQYRDLTASPDGNGLSAFYLERLTSFSEDYPYSLAYWHWCGSTERRQYFAVSSPIDEKKSIEELRERGFILASVTPSSFTWSGFLNYPDYQWYDVLYRSASGQIRSPGFVISEETDLKPLRKIENPTAGLYELRENRYSLGTFRNGVYSLENGFTKSPWDRIALTNYGTYEVTVAAVVQPVVTSLTEYVVIGPDGSLPPPRYVGGVQVRQVAGTADDWWRWLYEDFVMLINRHDFNTAVSVCKVDTVVHRQPLGIRRLLRIGPFAAGVFKQRNDLQVVPDGVAPGTSGSASAARNLWTCYVNPQSLDWWIVWTRRTGSIWFGSEGTETYYASRHNNPTVATAADAWPNEDDEDNAWYPLGTPRADLVWQQEPVPEIEELSSGGILALDVGNKIAPTGGLFSRISEEANLGTHVVSRFVLKIGRPKKLGDHKGLVKTILEFRPYVRTSAVRGALGTLVFASVTQFSREVDVIDEDS